LLGFQPLGKRRIRSYTPTRTRTRTRTRTNTGCGFAGGVAVREGVEEISLRTPTVCIVSANYPVVVGRGVVRPTLTNPDPNRSTTTCTTTTTAPCSSGHTGTGTGAAGQHLSATNDPLPTTTLVDLHQETKQHLYQYGVACVVVSVKFAQALPEMIRLP
jgi:hypothetical protein